MFFSLFTFVRAFEKQKTKTNLGQEASHISYIAADRHGPGAAKKIKKYDLNFKLSSDMLINTREKQQLDTSLSTPRERDWRKDKT